MSISLRHSLTNWRTTLSGFLSFIIATGAVVTAIPNHLISQKVSGIATVAVGLAKAWVGLISTDAGVVTAIPAHGGAPVSMPSTEVPLDPNATPIKE